MMLPRNIIMDMDKHTYLAECIGDFMNVYMKTSFIQSDLSLTHTLESVYIQDIVVKQLLNIPITEKVIIKSDVVSPVTDLFDDMYDECSTKESIHRTDEHVFLNMENDTYELFGYTEQIISILLSKKI